MIKNLLKADLRAILSNIRWLLICVLLLGLLSFISLIHPSEEAYLLCAYFYIPLFLMIFTSTFVSGERKSGFISRLFTSPISGKEYIMEKFLLGICIGFIYLGVTLPLSVLHIVYSGSGFALIFLRYFLSAFVLIAFSSGLGIFISIISSKDDVMAQLLGFALCVIFLWMSVSFAENLKEILTKSMTPSHIFLYIFHFSPLVCIMDFLNTCHAFQAGNPLISILVPLLFVIIFLVLSYIVFKKLQNVEGHDLKIGKALIIVILLAGSVLIPPMFGNTTYSAREVNALEINPWSYMLYGGGGGGVYIDHMGPVHKGIMWWGHPVEIYLEGFSDVKSLHNVTITFLSPKSFDIERFGNQRFIEFDPPELYFKELKVKNITVEVTNITDWSFVSFKAKANLPSTKVGAGFYYVVVSIDSDETECDYYYSQTIYDGKSVIALLVILLSTIAVLVWIFLKERKDQSIHLNTQASTKKML